MRDDSGKAAYVALLRAGNVGGHAPLAMAELRHTLQGVGPRNARMYAQSGNVVFDADEAPPLELATPIEVRIERDVERTPGTSATTRGRRTRVALAKSGAGDPSSRERPAMARRRRLRDAAST